MPSLRVPGRRGPGTRSASRSLHLLGLDHLAALLRALVRAAQVDVALTLARVLALAGVLRSRTAPLALARVYPGAVHLARRLVGGARHHVAGQHQGRGGARDQHSSSNGVHSRSSFAPSDAPMASAFVPLLLRLAVSSSGLEAKRLTSIVPSVPTTSASCWTRAIQPGVFFGVTPYCSRSKCSMRARMRSVRFEP